MCRHHRYTKSIIQKGLAMCNKHTDTSDRFIEYCCPKCGQVCTEAEVQQGFCIECGTGARD
jgi:hypothetical protein